MAFKNAGMVFSGINPLQPRCPCKTYLCSALRTHVLAMITAATRMTNKMATEKEMPSTTIFVMVLGAAALSNVLPSCCCCVRLVVSDMLCGWFFVAAQWNDYMQNVEQFYIFLLQYEVNSCTLLESNFFASLPFNGNACSSLSLVFCSSKRWCTVNFLLLHQFCVILLLAKWEHPLNEWATKIKYIQCIWFFCQTKCTHRDNTASKHVCIIVKK